MLNFKSYISPNDPESVYRLAFYCAIVGVVGTLIAMFMQSIIGTSLGTDEESKVCTFDQLTDFNHTCLDRLFELRSRKIGTNQFAHLLFVITGLLTCIPFFTMDDLYSGHKGVGVMRYCLIGGLVLECMKSAFSSGLRSAGGIISRIFRPDHRIPVNPYVSMEIAYMLYENCFTWVTFLRDSILAVGIYMACVFDKEDNVIGGKWRICGYVAAALGLITTILEFLKVVSYRTFDSASSFTYVIFFICYNIWILLFGVHCRNLSVENQAILDGEDTSGSDVSEGEAPVVEEVKPVEKKHRSHKQEVSDDDV